MSVTYTASTQYSTEICATCGISFGMPTEFHQRRRGDGGDFFCPAGHCNVYRETAQMRLEKAAKRAQELLEQERRLKEIAVANATYQSNRADIADRRRAATSGVVTRMKKRASAGACPCCTRTFSNMARHMKDMHPEFAKPTP